MDSVMSRLYPTQIQVCRVYATGQRFPHLTELLMQGTGIHRPHMSRHLGGSNQICMMTSAPAITAGAGGNGCARSMISSAVWSNADYPELVAMRAEVTLPCWSM